MKEKLRSGGMFELGKAAQYYQKNQESTAEMKMAEDKGLFILRGFKFTLTPLNKGIYLQLDVCSRVLQSRNLL